MEVVGGSLLQIWNTSKLLFLARFGEDPTWRIWHPRAGVVGLAVPSVVVGGQMQVDITI